MAESIISGRQGPKGDTGAKGATGSQGPKGDKGEKGDAASADLLFHVMKVSCSGTIPYSSSTGTQIASPHSIGFKPSFWLLYYSSSYSGNSTLQIIPYDTADHEFRYQGGQTAGIDYYMHVNGSTCYFTAKCWGYSGTGSTSGSALCQAVFFA